ncbi:hypothetical protein ASPCAL12816 [Aspergillus calidoustus]|uniref:Uncharacterized protein n=1 Tax=Aspergillus calidoustus TaxID=454130 RepID=A0A0U5GDH9_ASPCI|nr:hypothetical protein ASPCAL12816 [Aspergillus calidoustus]
MSSKQLNVAEQEPPSQRAKRSWEAQYQEHQNAKRLASLEKVETWLKAQQCDDILDLIENQEGTSELIARANAQIRLMAEACDAGRLDEAERLRADMMAGLCDWLRKHAQDSGMDADRVEFVFNLTGRFVRDN